MKYLRGFLLLLIIAGSCYLGRTSYLTIYEILDFQIVLYKRLLQAQDQVVQIKEGATSIVHDALTFFGVEQDTVVSDNQIATIQDKLLAFQDKLVFISGLLGTFIGILACKIGFELVFGLKKIINDVKYFITD